MATTSNDRRPIPPHIPAELVRDFDTRSDPLFQGDPHAGLHSLQGRWPMFFTPCDGGYWVVTDGAAVAEIFCDTDRFTAVGAFGIDNPLSIPMALDPPEHRKYRRLIDPAFLPKVMLALAGDVRALAVQLIEAVRGKGGCEFIGEVAEPFPVTIFLRLVDFPVEELSKFRTWAKAMFHDPDPARSMAAVGEIVAYLRGAIAERRARPGTDMISRLLAGEVEGQPLDDHELLSIMFTIFGGGLDTVLNSLAFIIRFLAEHPTHRQQLLHDPALIKPALEELMRRYSIASLYRIVKADMCFHGVTLKAGDRLWCSTVMLGIDEKLVSDPLKVDFYRPNVRNQIFGVGPHHCPGRHLARLELQIFLEEWLRRIPHFSIEAGARIQVLTGPSLGLVRLPLCWTVLDV